MLEFSGCMRRGLPESLVYGTGKMGIDPRTIFLAIMLILAVMGLAQFVVYHLRPGELYFGYWGLANFAGLVANLLLSLRGSISPLLSIATAHTLIVVAWCCCLTGCQLFSGRRPKELPLAVLTAAVFAALASPSPISEDPSWRIVVISSVCDFLVVSIGILCADIARRERLLGAWIAALLSFCVAILIVVRGCWAYRLIGSGAFLNLHDLGALLLPSIVVVLAWNLSLTFMVAERMRNMLIGAANRDELTAVLNRRGFQTALWEIMRQKSEAATGAVILIDLDYLKITNDTLGHAAGDRLLCCLAEAVKTQLRSGDAIGRLGGDEFAVVLTGVDARQAAEIAQRLRAGYVKAAALIAPDLHPSMSMGIAMISQEDRSMHDLIARADKALYRAKAAGRGRAVAWSSQGGMMVELQCAG